VDAVTTLNDKVDIEKLLVHYGFQNLNSDGNMIRCSCKMHNGNNPTAFVVNRDTGLWYCHTGSCGGGDAYTLVQRMENTSFPNAVRFIATFFNVDISELNIRERQPSYIANIKKFLSLMRDKDKEYPEFQINEEMRDVAKFRNFQESTLAYFGVKYLKRITLSKKVEGSYTLQNRLMFPINFMGRMVGASLRRLSSKDFPKWSHQNIDTGNFLYNYDNIILAREIVVCEGITDVMAFHELGIPAVATFGAHITHKQYKLLLKTGADIVLAFDGDEAGQLAKKKAIELLKNKANISIIAFLPGEDPENIPREILYERYTNRKRVK
jgi:DNA primase